MRTVSNISKLDSVKIGEIFLFTGSFHEFRNNAFLLVDGQIHYGDEHSQIAKILEKPELMNLRKANISEENDDELTKFAAGHILDKFAILDLRTIFEMSIPDAINILWEAGFKGIFLQSVKNKNVLERIW